MYWYSMVYLETLLIFGRIKVWVKVSLVRGLWPSTARTPLMKRRQKLKQLWWSSSNLRHRQVADRERGFREGDIWSWREMVSWRKTEGWRGRQVGIKGDRTRQTVGERDWEFGRETGGQRRRQGSGIPVPGRVPHWSIREAVQVLVPLSQQVEHVGSDQRNTDTALPPSVVSADPTLSVVKHNSYTQTHPDVSKEVLTGVLIHNSQ